MIDPPRLVLLQQAEDGAPVEVAARDEPPVEQEIVGHVPERSAQPAVHRKPEPRLAAPQRRLGQQTGVRLAQDRLAPPPADLAVRWDADREAHEAAVQERELFAARWDHKYPTISALWKKHWEQITPLFAFPPEIRKIIYTTNAVESLHMTLRKVIKTRGSFPNEESAMKLLYLALRNVSKKWGPLPNWKEALNRFALLWEARFPQKAL